MMDSTRIISSQYRNQQTKLVTIDFIAPLEINLSKVDGYLELFNIDSSEFTQVFETNYHALVWRIMTLIKKFLYDSGVPVFYTGEIIKLIVSPSDVGKIKAVIRIAYIEYIPQNCYTIAIDGGFNIVTRILKNTISIGDKNNLFKEINTKIIQPIKKNLPFGKSTISLLREAYRKGIPFFHMGSGVYQLGYGAKSRKIDRSTTDRDSAIGSKLSHHKAVAANIIRMAGLPAPEHGIAQRIDEAYAIADRLGWPIVVKPSDLDRGEGVSVNIISKDTLKDAFVAARKLSRNKHVMIERQVEGICHRIVVAQGKVLYGVARLPKSIQADGIHTIDQLIYFANAKENDKAPWEYSKPFPRDAEALKVLNLAGYTFNSIPNKDEWVSLRYIESSQWGGRSVEVTHDIHPDNINLALQAASLFELDIAGVDIITRDISVPWYENGAIFNEINFAPLLGSSEIPQKYIPYLIESLVEENGRIPIEAFVGDHRAMNAAFEKQKELSESGVKCFITSDTQTFNEMQLLISLSNTGLNYRAKALIHNKNVEALLIVITTDEILRDDFVLGVFDRLHVCSEYLISSHPSEAKIPAHFFNRYVQHV